MFAITRHTRTHLTAQATLAGRGLYINRTADGMWWAIRLRARHPRRCGDWLQDPPPDIGNREPRRPLGPGPSSTTTAP